MRIIDLAPTAEIQELLVMTYTGSNPPAVRVPVRQPLLGAAAVQRAVDAGAHLPIVLACCSDVGVLSMWVERFTNSDERWGHLRNQTEMCAVVSENPVCTEALLWTLVDNFPSCAATAGPVIDRMCKLAEEGIMGELLRRLEHDIEKVPETLLNGVAHSASLGTIRKVLQTSGSDALAHYMHTRADFWENPDLFHHWFESRLDKLVHASREFERQTSSVFNSDGCTPSYVGEDVLYMLGTWCESTPYNTMLAIDPYGWVASHGAELVTSPAGARLVRILETLSQATPHTSKILRNKFTCADLSTVSDETLAEYPGEQVYAAELLRRRGVIDPEAWLFVATSTQLPDTAADLADLATVITY